MKRNNKISPYTQWYVWVIIAFVNGFFGGLLISYAKQYVYPPEGLIFVGAILILISIIFDILALKALITEAHVKALEVFYGKERAVKSDITKNKVYTEYWE